MNTTDTQFPDFFAMDRSDFIPVHHDAPPAKLPVCKQQRLQTGSLHTVVPDFSEQSRKNKSGTPVYKLANPVHIWVN
jgi:hypothetical protein